MAKSSTSARLLHYSLPSILGLLAPPRLPSYPPPPCGTLWDLHLAEVLVEPSIDGNGGIPAGCQSDKDNNIWIADMRLGIIKVHPDGKFVQICQKDSKGDIMQGCNDCAYDYTGNLWVTAPAGEIAPHPYRRSFETGSPKTLIVAETPTKTLWAYDIKGPGELGPKSKWGKLPGTLEGGPDGMDLDEEDNLLVAHWGSGHIEVFGRDGGEPHTRIKCPFDRPSNLHFKKGTKTVYVTEHDSHALWKFDWKRGGKPQFCDT
ncbi:hypothetical protein FSP39_008960 [Pinctada imbricata]|uniref:SMP-30/Gluconolactonase/LRE-like region domain-containing protein n=1 Tax=Pinctada imbricata TaxID=66713 RepID=A0AA88XQX1_PINIB|nr:hypothetical protein FSP39_008960 [Pinctada imbricata]